MGWQFSLDIQEHDGCDGCSVRAMRYEFPWKYREFFSFVLVIMTGLLGCCSSSTLRSRSNDYVKTLGFWLHHSPCSLECWTNNTLVALSLSPKQAIIWISSCIVYWRINATLNLDELIPQKWQPRRCFAKSFYCFIQMTLKFALFFILIIVVIDNNKSVL